MPIINRQDAEEVDQYIRRFFAAPGAGRAQALRRLFVEKLDFAGATGAVSLDKGPKNVALPPTAERIASMEGLRVVYVPLSGAPSPDRVRKAEAATAAKLIADELHGDLLLVMTNTSCSQLHVIWPTFRFDKLTTSTGASPSLRRMIVERDLPRRTAVQQLSNIYWQWKDTGSIRMAVDRAFDVDAVTREFFKEYKSVFESVMTAVTGFGVDEEEAEAKKLFVQTLFNRLMFIYFISRKGWLAYDRDKDYLNALWRAHETRPDENKNFYADRLRLLFFAGLNNPKSQDLTSESESHRLIGIVPFLNGGLFDRTDEDNRTRVLVPDDCIQEILSKLFDRFNFTVMESTPFDVEVAVDPEMLGKVFEELVTGRHESGSYYTPRPVVAFMCREALKGYLETQNTGASTEAIAAFVDHKDSAGLTLSSAPKIGEALAKVKVVDPACGSGAYLLGMMQELVELMTTLYSAQLSHEAQDLYNLKLRIIEQNLYGADIDQFAVNIAMLRLWLSLAIEYDGTVPPPLPNLDFKIVCGDSLLGPDPSPENYGTLFRHRIHELAGQLANLKDKHMREPGPQKEHLSNDIKAIKQQLREALTEAAAPERVVDWRVEFAEVFDQNCGFDVAIANPPYGIEADVRRRALAGINDSYPSFILLATELAPKGMLAFITPTSWETGEGYTTFRKRLFRSAAILAIVNLPYDVFAAAYVDTAVTVAAVNGVRSTTLRFATLDKRTNLNLDAINSYLDNINWIAIDKDPLRRIPITSLSLQVLQDLSATTLPLQSLVESKRGIEAYMYELCQAQLGGQLPFFAGVVHRYYVSSFDKDTFVGVSDRDSRFHTSPRILVRRLVSRSNRIMAARTNDVFVCKKDLYCLLLRKQQTLRLPTVLAVLNSSMISFLYLSRSAAATKDDFRQITLSGLRELPIASAFTDDSQEEIERLIKVIESKPDSEDALEADLELDQIVFGVYGISSKERGRIIEWLGRPG